MSIFARENQSQDAGKIETKGTARHPVKWTSTGPELEQTARADVWAIPRQNRPLDFCLGSHRAEVHLLAGIHLPTTLKWKSALKRQVHPLMESYRYTLAPRMASLDRLEYWWQHFVNFPTILESVIKIWYYIYTWVPQAILSWGRIIPATISVQHH